MWCRFMFNSLLPKVRENDSDYRANSSRVTPLAKGSRANRSSLNRLFRPAPWAVSALRTPVRPEVYYIGLEEDDVAAIIGAQGGRGHHWSRVVGGVGSLRGDRYGLDFNFGVPNCAKPV